MNLFATHKKKIPNPSTINKFVPKRLNQSLQDTDLKCRPVIYGPLTNEINSEIYKKCRLPFSPKKRWCLWPLLVDLPMPQRESMLVLENPTSLLNTNRVAGAPIPVISAVVSTNSSVGFTLSTRCLQHSNPTRINQQFQTYHRQIKTTFITQNKLLHAHTQRLQKERDLNELHKEMDIFGIEHGGEVGHSILKIFG